MQTRRLYGAAAIAAASSLALLPSAASARPHRRASGPHRVTINAAPNPITNGDGVVIFGRLTGRGHQNQRVQLYHRLPGQRFFTLVQTGRTGPAGQYEFDRVAGVVDTNRTWYVFSDGAFSRKVRERVHADITLNPLASTNLVTGTPYTFTGTVAPKHAGERVELQRKQPGNGDDWFTIDQGRINADGTYSITHRFRDPSTDQALGDAEIRVHFRGDNRNIQSSSDSLSVQVSQKQNPNLVINATPDPISIGQSVTISGTVGATAAGKALQLESRTDRTAFAPVPGATTVAGSAGSSYTFVPQSPMNNTLYRVVTTGPTATPPVSSAVIYVGVKDTITATASTSSTTAGSVVTFTGAVAPSKVGHVLYLERQNPRTGDFHIVQVASVGAGSQYTINHRIVVPGAPAVFRVKIPGGPENQGAASQPIPIQVAQNATPLS